LPSPTIQNQKRRDQAVISYRLIHYTLLSLVPLASQPGPLSPNVFKASHKFALAAAKLKDALAEIIAEAPPC